MHSLGPSMVSGTDTTPRLHSKRRRPQASAACHRRVETTRSQATKLATMLLFYLSLGDALTSPTQNNRYSLSQRFSPRSHVHQDFAWSGNAFKSSSSFRRLILFDEHSRDGEGNLETTAEVNTDEGMRVNGGTASNGTPVAPSEIMGVNGNTVTPVDVPKANGKSASLANNGVTVNGDSNAPVNVAKKNGRKKPSPTAPEVNKWTTLMADGTNAAIHRPGKEMTIREGTEQLYNDLRDMSDFDNEQVEHYWDEIMPTISYLGTESVAKIKQALRVAYRAHRGQNRKSGEPYIIHPVEVGILLSGLRMDAETIMSGLLHDTVEDTDLTFTQVEAMFGHVVRSIVEGETKVSKLPKLAFENFADEQAENLRQMFVAMTDDYRIIIVKLADRLHNMRTLQHMKPEKQQKISRETLDIFAPLAHRMGIWQFKSELEDTSFMYLYPEEYKELNKKLRRHQTKFRDTLEKANKALREKLNADKTLQESSSDITVSGRTKERYSLWHKMDSRGETELDHISDVVALRVILTPKIVDELTDDESEQDNSADRGVWLCYHVLGIVQHLPGFQPVPTKVKDYISFPKPNGYQSLHTALMLNGQTVEVQIRTSAMHEVAEYGMAAHWSYTDGKKRNVLSARHNELYNTPWLSSIKEWQEDVVCSRDFVDSVRRELLGKRVFVFLRNGKILNLARGATVIDAAFQIHTEVGLKMHGVQINGKPVPFSYELKNGDVVSVLTGEGKPSTDWMRYAKSRSTRSKLRSYFRTKQREGLREAGEILLLDFVEMHKDLIEETSFRDGEWTLPTTGTDFKNILPGNTRYQDVDVDEMFIDVGKRHDRGFLRSLASKLFLVPLSILVEAEQNMPISYKSLSAVRQNRKLARDAGAAAEVNIPERRANSTPPSGRKTAPAESPPLNNEKSTSLDEGKIVNGRSDAPDPVLDENFEYADFDHICEECLPLRGDQIIGTKHVDWTGQPIKDAVTTVHRVGCAHAQRAINRSFGNRGKKDSDGRLSEEMQEMKGEQMQGRRRRRSQSGKTSDPPVRDEIPMKLQWADVADPSEKDVFLAEILLFCEDRKKLLADCSEVVSELSSIFLTGSSSSEEHATLVFLIRVTSIDHLQHVMDSLVEIPSVMSVERRFGSDLLS